MSWLHIIIGLFSSFYQHLYFLTLTLVAVKNSTPCNWQETTVSTGKVPYLIPTVRQPKTKTKTNLNSKHKINNLDCKTTLHLLCEKAEIKYFIKIDSNYYM